MVAVPVLPRELGRQGLETQILGSDAEGKRDRLDQVGEGPTPDVLRYQRVQVARLTAADRAGKPEHVANSRCPPQTAAQCGRENKDAVPEVESSLRMRKGTGHAQRL